MREIILMEGGGRVLTAFPEPLSEKAEKLVTRLGVEVKKNVMVTSVDEEGVTYKSGDATERLAARTVLWAGGVTTNSFGKTLAARTKAETDRNGRIKVTPQLTVPNYPDILCGRDLATLNDERGKALAGRGTGGDAGRGFTRRRRLRRDWRGSRSGHLFNYFNKVTWR